MKRRHKFINILVLGVYLFHALLPLLYSTESARADCPADYAYAPSSIVQQSIPGQNLFPVPSGEQNDDLPAAAGHVLLKKKRAIAPSCKGLTAKLFPHYAGYFYFEPFLEKSLVVFRSPGESQNRPDGFQFYHSGASPPSPQLSKIV